MPAFGQSADNSIAVAAGLVPPERFAAIVFCPCCVTAVDIETQDGNERYIECVACGQSWTMTVSKERQAAHSVN